MTLLCGFMFLELINLYETTLSCVASTPPRRWDGLVMEKGHPQGSYHGTEGKA